MTFISRPAREEDLAFIIRLSEKVFSRYGNYNEIVFGWYKQPEVMTEVIAEENTPLGFAMLAMEKDRVFGAKRAHLLAIGVLPDRQRKGIGTSLLGSAEDLARQYGCKEMFLMTAVDNQAALAFFHKAGFRVVGTEYHYYPRGQPALAMSKSLS